MQNNQIPLYSAYQPSLSYRLRHSKALFAILAVLGVTVMALAAALLLSRSDAQPGVSSASAPAAVTSLIHTSKLAGTSAKPAQTVSQQSTAPVVVAKAAVCADCGTVQSVTALERQGQVNGMSVGNTTIGLGTVAGGVLGGLLGHQVGNGNGKTVATLLGAAGGAYAGNNAEKNMQKVTVFEVRVRMDDGSLRNMDISTAVPVGSQVIVEGKNLRLAAAKG